MTVKHSNGFETSTVDPTTLPLDELVMYEYAQKEASKFVCLIIMTLLHRLRGTKKELISAK